MVIDRAEVDLADLEDVIKSKKDRAVLPVLERTLELRKIHGPCGSL